MTTVRTSEPSYAPGQTVIISVAEANDGPACFGMPLPVCGPLQAFASAYNPAGEDVWDSGASKAIPGHITCPLPRPMPSSTWPAYYPDTQELAWSQDKCTLWPGLPGHANPDVNPDCPGTRVPAGTYRIVGVSVYRTSAQATITISG